MVGLVIVSHSEKLAQGVLELISQMTQGKVNIAIAGGIDDPDNPIGTDAMKVMQAIEEVYSEDGVLVLMDLGSALLSAEMALEFIAPEQQDKVMLCAAPLVEGALAAAVQASIGSPLEVVCQEAKAALQAKYIQLGEELEIQAAAATPVPTGEGPQHEVSLFVHNRLGIHLRPASQFVATASEFRSEIALFNLTTGRGPVNAKSLGQVNTLGVRYNHEVKITAQGEDAESALAALSKLIADNFGEPEEGPIVEVSPVAEVPTMELLEPQAGTSYVKGVPVAPGIALGPAYLFEAPYVEAPVYKVADTEAEFRRLSEALNAANHELRILHNQTARQVGAYEADIFEAQRLYLEDPELLASARQRIMDENLNAEAAWDAVVKEMGQQLSQLDDPYLSARAADVDDIGQRVLRLLLGAGSAKLSFAEPAILIAGELSPSDVAQLDTTKVLAICTAFGGSTSHAAILARALGIPAVVGCGAEVLQVAPGVEIAIDGRAGLVYTELSAERREELSRRREAWLEAQAAALAAALAPAVTQDGHRVEIVANIGSMDDARKAINYGAEGVGLLRTEFLYLERQEPPTEDEQFEIYKGIADVLESRPFVIRTLDIGGDKPLPYIDTPAEANPFLGWRGIRLCLDRTDLFKTQLRAILRASPGHQFKVMFPMVSNLDEIRAVKALLAEVQDELQEARVPFDPEIEVGIMVEVPAAAVLADQLAQHVDFFSIGTNDLSQYTYAADRGNAQVNHLADALNPAVLRLIGRVITAAHQAGIWVGLCGELAGSPLAAPVLLGLGLDEFSMASPAIPEVKQQIAKLSFVKAQSIAHKVLDLDSASAVREYLESLEE